MSRFKSAHAINIKLAQLDLNSITYQHIHRTDALPIQLSSQLGSARVQIYIKHMRYARDLLNFKTLLTQ